MKNALILLVVLMTGCTNNALRQNVANPINNLFANLTGSSQLPIHHVVKSNADPDNFVDILSNEIGVFGKNCVSKGDGSGESSCQCRFKYTTGQGFGQELLVPTAHTEDNLIRCQYSQILAGATAVDVTVLVDGGIQSNTLVFNFEGVDNALNVTDPASFPPVSRFQCRDRPFIKNLLEPNADNKVYDPIQSDDTRLSYAFNFYSTNLGNAIVALGSANTKVSEWECNYHHELPSWWENRVIFSRSARVNLSGAVVPFPGAEVSKLISPKLNDTTFDSTLFHLARKKTGVFNKPVNGYAGPNLLSCDPDSTNGKKCPKPIGYAALPISIGNDRQSCSQLSTSIPSGYRWVKLWAFRYEHAARKPVDSVAPVVGEIACNPGTFIGRNEAVFSNACGRGLDNSSTTTLAARVFLESGRTRQTVACFDVVPGANHNPPLEPAADAWSLSDNTSTEWGMGGTSTLAEKAPTGSGDPDAGKSRFDYLLIATPDTVHRSDMLNLNGTNAATPFAPITYRRLEDCDPKCDNGTCQDPYLDPESDTACAQTNIARKQVYEIWLSKITDSTTQIDTAKYYPLCALQPIGATP